MHNVEKENQSQCLRLILLESIDVQGQFRFDILCQGEMWVEYW